MKNRIKIFFVAFAYFTVLQLNAQVIIGDCNTELTIDEEFNLSGVNVKYKASEITANIPMTNNSNVELWGFSGVLLDDGFSVEDGSTLFAISDCEVANRNIPLTENMCITPNPTSSNALVEIDLDAAADLQISLINPFGQVIKTLGDAQQYGIGVNTFTLEMSELPSGIYIVQATDGKRISSRRVIKQ